MRSDNRFDAAPSGPSLALPEWAVHWGGDVAPVALKVSLSVSWDVRRWVFTVMGHWACIDTPALGINGRPCGGGPARNMTIFRSEKVFVTDGS